MSEAIAPTEARLDPANGGMWMADSVEQSGESSVMAQQKSDRREHPRKPCFMAVDCSNWGDSLKGFVKDISLGGAFILSIETDRVLSVGQLITVNFATLPDKQGAIELPAEVVWNMPEGIGVKFTAPDKDLEAIIESL